MWFDVRPLSGTERDEAAQVATDKALDLAARAGEALASIRSDSTPAAKPAPFDSFDKTTAIESGLRGWSYADEECNADNKLLLDGQTRDWLFTLIMGKSVYTPGED